MRRFGALLLLAAPAAAAERAPAPRPLPDESGFPAALRAALGPHFEYLGGEPGIARGELGDPPPRRFWLAKIRAKRPGIYTLRYTVRLDPPHLSEISGVAKTAEYKHYFVVAKAGTKRVFQPQLFSGQTYPNATVSDTLILPVHTDPGRREHRFERVVREPLDDPGFHHLQDFDDWGFRTIDQWPPARVSVPPRLSFVNSWRMFESREPEGRTVSFFGAYLEFSEPGSFNLTARLSHEPPGAPGRQSLHALLHRECALEIGSTPFRVVPRNQPVTVVLGHFSPMRWYENGSACGWGEQIACGTLEARVGDTVVLDCGIDADPPDNGPERGAVVEALPFRDVRPYEPR